MTPRLLALVLVLAAAPPGAAAPAPHEPFAVRAKAVITMTGEELSPGVVVVREGRFAAVGGADLDVPKGLEVVDASGQVLMPGFIDAHSQRGLDRTYETAPNSSFVRVSDALNAMSLEIEDARRAGITTLLVSPDDSALVGGRAAIAVPSGISVDEMVVEDDAFLKISLQPGQGGSRMGHLARLREILDDTKRFMEERRRRPSRAEGAPRGERARSVGGPDVEPQREALVALLEDRIPALVYCPTAADVATCFGLAKDYGFHVVPLVGPAAWRAAELLRTNNVSVVTTPLLEAWERQPDGTLLHVELPRVLHEAGVPFALTTDASELGAQHPWFQAALAVRAGVPRDAALAAVTRVPARILGFGHRKGVVRVGADADFVLLSDDPLSGRAWVDASYVRGRRIYDRATDEKLERLLSRTNEPPLAASEADHVEDEEDARDPSTSPPGEAPDEEPAGASEDELEQRWPVPPRRRR